MLDAYIIEEIKKREEEKRRRDDASRPRLQIEVPSRRPERTDREVIPGQEDEPHDDDRDEREDRGIIRIDLVARAP